MSGVPVFPDLMMGTEPSQSSFSNIVRIRQIVLGLFWRCSAHIDNRWGCSSSLECSNWNQGWRKILPIPRVLANVAKHHSHTEALTLQLRLWQLSSKHGCIEMLEDYFEWPPESWNTSPNGQQGHGCNRKSMPNSKKDWRRIKARMIEARWQCLWRGYLQAMGYWCFLVEIFARLWTRIFQWPLRSRARTLEGRREVRFDMVELLFNIVLILYNVDTCFSLFAIRQRPDCKSKWPGHVKCYDPLSPLHTTSSKVQTPSAIDDRRTT